MLDSKLALIKAIQAGLQPKYLCFWGHHPARDGSLTKGCLSQWWAAPFFADGIVYPTAEHYMMAQKARLFDDSIMLEKIIKAPTPKDAKLIGRSVSGFDAEIWEQHRSAIVIEGNYYKFTQNAALQNFLLATGDRVLVEASPADRIWGIGLAEDHPNATEPKAWPGLNLLGFALMQVRDRLRNLEETPS